MRGKERRGPLSAPCPASILSASRSTACCSHLCGSVPAAGRAAPIGQQRSRRRCSPTTPAVGRIRSADRRGCSTPQAATPVGWLLSINSGSGRLGRRRPVSTRRARPAPARARSLSAAAPVVSPGPSMCIRCGAAGDSQDAAITGRDRRHARVPSWAARLRADAPPTA
jgi:hypothetical protein